MQGQGLGTRFEGEGRVAKAKAFHEVDTDPEPLTNRSFIIFPEDITQVNPRDILICIFTGQRDFL